MFSELNPIYDFIITVINHKKFTIKSQRWRMKYCFVLSFNDTQSCCTLTIFLVENYFELQFQFSVQTFLDLSLVFIFCFRSIEKSTSTACGGKKEKIITIYFSQKRSLNNTMTKIVVFLFQQKEQRLQKTQRLIIINHVFEAANLAYLDEGKKILDLRFLYFESTLSVFFKSSSFKVKRRFLVMFFS